MITDLDRLHRVVSGELTGPRVGKTFVRCHLIAGALEVGEEHTVAVLAHWQRQMPYVKRMLVDVLSEHGIVPISFGIDRWVVQVPDVGVRHIRFVSEEFYLDGLDASIVEIDYE